MSRAFFWGLIGGIAGFLGWLLIEPTRPSLSDKSAWSAFEIRLFFAWGLLISASLGACLGYARGSLRQAGIGALLATLMGGGGLTIAVGILAIVPENSALISLIRPVIFAILGAGLGGGIGASGLTLKRFLRGLLSGAIAGVVAGFLFEIAATVFGTMILMSQGLQSGEVGGPGRAILGAMLGLCIGAGLAIAESIATSAWIRYEVGRNEGKEWGLDKPVSHIGRDERADVPIFADPTIAALHCSVLKTPSGWMIQDHGAPIGTGVNGVRVQGNAPLAHGSVIQIGSVALQFLVKNQPRPAVGPEMHRHSNPLHVGARVDPAPVDIPLPPHPAAPVRAQTHPRLVALEGPFAGQPFTIKGAVEVGRESLAIPLTHDQRVSRRHAKFQGEPGRLSVTDLGSTNGILVNGTKTSHAELNSGDIVTIGSSSFKVDLS